MVNFVCQYLEGKVHSSPIVHSYYDLGITL